MSGKAAQISCSWLNRMSASVFDKMASVFSHWRCSLPCVWCCRRAEDTDDAADVCVLSPSISGVTMSYAFMMISAHTTRLIRSSFSMAHRTVCASPVDFHRLSQRRMDSVMMQQVLISMLGEWIIWMNTCSAKCVEFT